MSDTKPHTLPTIEGIRNPRKKAIGQVLHTEIDAQGLTARCLARFLHGTPGQIKYPRLLAIVNGACDARVDELATICDALNITVEHVVRAAAEHHTK